MPNEKEGLLTFLDRAQEELDYTISNFEILSETDVKKYIQLSISAFEEVKQGGFSKARDHLSGDRLENKLKNQLEDNGLTGSQLELKLELHGTLRKKVDRFISGKESLPNEQSSKAWIRRDFKRLLDSVATILSSLNFIPGAEQIREIAEALKIMI